MIKELTSLRGLFILFIFFHHLGVYPGGGSMAVAFFFVLGGFSMTLGYKDRLSRPDFGYRQYITRRAIKFYPLHWLCLLAALPLVGLPSTMKQGGVFMLNAALMQTLLPLKPLFFSYNAVSWYLADTLFFAVVFPPLLRLILKASTRGRTVVATAISLLYAAAVISLPTKLYHPILYISPYARLVDFVFGIFLALAYMRLSKSGIVENLPKSTYLWIVFVVGLILLLVIESCLLVGNPVINIAPVYFVPIGLLVLSASMLGRTGGGYNILQNKYLLSFGDLSFTIFLTHQLVLRYGVILQNHLHVNNGKAFALITLTTTIVGSYILDRYILKPITRWLTKRILQSMTAR